MSQITSQLYAPLLGGWIVDTKNELMMYSDRMTTTHWGIVCGCTVVFGFMCLKSSGINKR